MKCLQCGCEDDKVDNDGIHHHWPDCISALKARVEELEESIKTAFIKGREDAIEQAGLKPFHVYVVHGDGRVVEVGEVPETGCTPLCPLYHSGKSCWECSCDDDCKLDLWEYRDGKMSPGPNCPRGGKK